MFEYYDNMHVYLYSVTRLELMNFFYSIINIQSNCPFPDLSVLSLN